MNPTKAVVIVLSSSLGGGAIGCLVGWILGTQMPSYYRSVFVNGREPGFDPLAVGIGQGLTQGLAGGIMAGLAILGLLIWRELALEKARQKNGCGNE